MTLLSRMDKLGDVYSPADDFQAVVKAGLVCGLYLVSEVGAVTGVDRAELLARRRLLWDPSYTTMPEEAQVEIDGERWQLPRGGGISYPTRHDGNPPVYGRAEVLKTT